MLFYVKLPVAPATTINAWTNGIAPAATPTHYEAWITLGDLLTMLELQGVGQ